MGVGLSIAKSIVQAHGGELWVENTGPGQGARFVMALPLSTEKIQKDD
jgi:signal transduction histidine kinase